MAAGVVAALRSRWRDLSPRQMHALLRGTARKTETTAWNERFGHGILDAKAAYERADSRYP
jgi:hypothetical protein